MSAMSKTSDIAEDTYHKAREMLASSSWHQRPPIHPSLLPEALQQLTPAKLTHPLCHSRVSSGFMGTVSRARSAGLRLPSLSAISKMSGVSGWAEET